MKKARVIHYTPKDKTSIYTRDRKYSLYIGEQFYYFDNKKDLDRFRVKLSEELTNLMFQLNDLIICAFDQSRILWYYTNNKKEFAVYHDKAWSGILNAITTLDNSLKYRASLGNDSFRNIRLSANYLDEVFKDLSMIARGINHFAQLRKLNIEKTRIDHILGCLSSVLVSPFPYSSKS